MPNYKSEYESFRKELKRSIEKQERVSESDEQQSEEELSEYFTSKKNEQLIKFRRHVKNILLGLLVAEILFVGYLILAQGFGWGRFSLNPWILGTFVNGVLIQTFFSVRIIVKSLFPDNDANL